MINILIKIIIMLKWEYTFKQKVIIDNIPVLIDAILKK